MIKELLTVKETDSLDDLRTRLATAIGWTEPVPVAAFVRAVSDPMYAAALITSRNTPGFLEPLLNDPRNLRYLPAVKEISNARLAANAAKAMLQWGKSGFSVADAETIERRENACLSCEHLTEPKKLLQKLMPAGASRDEVGRRVGNRVCDMCGCQVSKKMRLPTEACPSAHQTLVGLSRWREPLAVSNQRADQN
jgi:hypothetical protein